MNITVPFKWMLTPKKLKKLNEGFFQKYRLVNVDKENLFITLLKREYHTRFSFLLGICRNIERNLVNICLHVKIFKTNPMQKLGVKKMKLRKNKDCLFVRLKSAIQKEITDQRKIIVKGNVKFCISNSTGVTAANKPSKRKKLDSSSHSELVNSPEVTTANEPSTQNKLDWSLQSEKVNYTSVTTMDKPFARNELNSHSSENVISAGVTAEDNSFIPNKRNSSSRSEKSIKFQPSAKKFSNNIPELFNNSIKSDVTITCQSVSFFAHRFVLLDRCPVLVKGCSRKKKRRKKESIIIRDLNVSIFKILLFYIYTGEIETLTLHTACDLLYAANRYSMQTLIDVCMDYLRRSLSVDNVIFIYYFSYLFYPALKPFAVEYLTENVTAVQNTIDWHKAKMANPHLVQELLTEVMKLKPFALMAGAHLQKSAPGGKIFNSVPCLSVA